MHKVSACNFFVADNCGFPSRKFTVPQIPNLVDQQEQHEAVNCGLRRRLALVHTICQEYKINFGTVMLSIDASTEHLIPFGAHNVMKLEEEFTRLERRKMNPNISEHKKRFVKKIIDAKGVVLAAARDQSDAGTHI